MIKGFFRLRLLCLKLLSLKLWTNCDNMAWKGTCNSRIVERERQRRLFEYMVKGWIGSMNVFMMVGFILSYLYIDVPYGS